MRVHRIFATALLCVAAVGCRRTGRPVLSPGVPAVEPTVASVEPVEEPARMIPIDWSRFDSTSLRNPNDGSLRGGVPLPEAVPGLRFNPARDPKARYGTVEVIRGLVNAAGRVDRELGGLPVTINELSYEQGGPIPHHRSHQSGRDADAFFYQLGPDGEPIESVGAFFDPEGNGIDFKDLTDPSDDVALRLDVPRTWMFLQALLEDDQAQLQQIFVAEHLRTLLLAYARAQQAPESTISRFAEMTCQPAYPHDDHFHFRFFCALDDIAEGCRDSPPMYPRQRQKLARAGLRPRPLVPVRAQAQAPIVTHEEARKAAGPMDREVERWLERREEWIEPPHPGRTYCP